LKTNKTSLESTKWAQEKVLEKICRPTYKNSIGPSINLIKKPQIVDKFIRWVLEITKSSKLVLLKIVGNATN